MCSLGYIINNSDSQNFSIDCSIFRNRCVDIFAIFFKHDIPRDHFMLRHFSSGILFCICGQSMDLSKEYAGIIKGLANGFLLLVALSILFWLGIFYLMAVAQATNNLG